VETPGQATILVGPEGGPSLPVQVVCDTISLTASGVELYGGGDLADAGKGICAEAH
jgi:hypothetical protein